MDVTAKKVILRLILALGLLAAAGAACAQQTVDYRYQWAACPSTDDLGNVLSQAVGYEVYVREDAEPERLLTTVMGDTTYTLAARPGVVQRIRVCGFDSYGRTSEKSDWSEPVYFEDELRTGEGVPSTAALQGNYPNPFNPQTVIRYGIPETTGPATPVSLEIYTLQGRRIRTLDVDRTPGWHEAIWDGTDDRGRTQATGLYISRFIVGESMATGKMTMLK